MIRSNSNLDTAYACIDGEYQRQLEQSTYLAERWLLAQTLYSGMERRSLYGLLPIADGARVLDVGTGFGTLAVELAAFKNLRIHAVDLNQATLGVAQDIYNRVTAANVLREGSSVTFEKADIYNLSFDDATFDVVLARYVYQHLADPQLATAQIARVLKPGGHVCLIDVDDQFNLTYPEPSDSFQKLQEAFGMLQERQGGDRFVGRKLANYLHHASLEVVGTLMQPQCQFSRTANDDLGLELTLTRLNDARQQIVEHGIMGASEFDSCLTTFRQDVVQWQFHASGQVVVVARG